MKKIVFILWLSLFGLAAHAQEVTGREETVTFVEQMPEFPGGNEAMNKFINDNIKYPNAAIENDVQGRVIAQFTINTKGDLEDITIIQSLSKECDAEVLRLIGSMPKWKPGKQNGNLVNVRYTLPIRFSIENRSAKKSRRK